MVAHAYNTSTLEGPGEGITWGQEFKICLAKMTKRHHYHKYKKWPGAMAHAGTLSSLGGWGGWVTWVQEFETSLANTVKLHLY